MFRTVFPYLQINITLIIVSERLKGHAAEHCIFTVPVDPQHVSFKDFIPQMLPFTCKLRGPIVGLL